jgi:CubicO group peptidase (beta-lactamase class C family)
MAPWQRHFAWSVSKVVISSALAVLVERGEVDMETPVDRYLPVLRDSAWAGIPLAHIAHMASGIDCLDSDGYQDKNTCIYTLEESLDITAPTGRNPRFLEHLKSMEMHRESGTRNEYVSANTNVLGLVIEAVTKEPLPRALQELLWKPMGAEADGLLAISREGYSYASSGLSARLRDIARFGLLYLGRGSAGGPSSAMVKRIQGDGVPLTGERIATLRETLVGDPPTRASWQWDLVWEDGALFKSGYSGQGIYVDPARYLVVAWFGTGEDFDEKSNSMLPVTRELVVKGVFDTLQ